MEETIFGSEQMVRDLGNQLAMTLLEEFGIKKVDFTTECETGNKHYLGRRVSLVIPSAIRKNVKVLNKISKTLALFYGEKVVLVLKDVFDDDETNFWFDLPKILSSKDYDKEYPNGFQSED